MVVMSFLGLLLLFGVLFVGLDRLLGVLFGIEGMSSSRGPGDSRFRMLDCAREFRSRGGCLGDIDPLDSGEEGGCQP
jgi:hypothetical protein